MLTADRRPQTADRRPQTADRNAMSLPGVWRRWFRLLSSPPESSVPAARRAASSGPAASSAHFPAAARLRRAAGALLLGAPLLAGLATDAQAQTTPSLTLDPTTIQAGSLNGATITLIPKNATFLAAGGGGIETIESKLARSAIRYVHRDDLVKDTEDEILFKIPITAVRLSATGLALITLSGAPAGLTIASGRLLAQTAEMHGLDNHRSVEITLAYSGATITANDPVTVNVNGSLLRLNDGTGDDVSGLSADFTIQAAMTTNTAPVFAD
ncbi:MAG: hypothetical protein F4147_04590 [Gammaproteobacteria bacterium]|nr:hypothetical protein [Gammaproteobacteria bacterium]